MTAVIAKDRGYFGGIVREVGERFEVPDDVWDNEKTRPSWAAPAEFGGKGDHDGDGKAGGSKPAKGKPVKGKPADAEVFGDAPAPIDASPRGNGVKEALGTEPDWVQPKPID